MHPRHPNLRTNLLIPFFVCLLAGCNDLFDVHPYDMHLHGARDLNNVNIKNIQETCQGKDTLRIAFISDTHGWYTQLEDEIHDINQRDSIDFVIHCGDLTDTGTTKEYKWIRDYLNRLNKPYIAVVGNHDFLGTGDEAYDWMFGKKDFSFIINRLKIVCLDTNAMEYDRMAAVPDFNFIENEANNNDSLFDRTILIMHAPPYSDEFNNNVSKVFGYYLTLFPGLMFCVYGHEHEDKTMYIYDNVPPFYGIDCVAHRNYKIFTIKPDGYEVSRINF